MLLHDKVAIVTGGAQGLGKGFAEMLLKRGAKVCIADVKVQSGEETVSIFQRVYGSARACFIKCDVASEADVKAVFKRVMEQYGRLDLLVNNAGISGEGHWDLMVDINLKGVILCTMHALEIMRKDKGGSGGTIINIASTAALVPVFTTPVYSATKVGVMGYTRSLAANPYAKTMGVNFACLCPSFANTAILTTEKNKYMAEAKQMMEVVGIMEVDQVVAAFEKLLDIPDHNGVVMAVTKKKGTKIVHKASRL